MKEKDKAIELVKKYYQIITGFSEKEVNVNWDFWLSCKEDIDMMDAKKCTIILLEEILNNFGLVCDGKLHYTTYSAIDFYQKVKEEIIKLK